MRIAVMADTHDRLPGEFLRALEGADEVWHLGDVCHPGLLERVGAAAGCPLLVVRGNCDAEEAWPMTLDLEREGERFHLVHIAPARAPAGAGWVLHGHTHVPRDEVVGGVRYVNPGSVGKTNRGAPASMGFLEYEGYWRWRIWKPGG